MFFSQDTSPTLSVPEKTASTFDRYNIVDEANVREAVVTTAAWVDGAKPKQA